MDCDESHAQSRSPALTTNVLASFFVTLLISRQPISRPAQEVCDFESAISTLRFQIWPRQSRRRQTSHTPSFLSRIFQYVPSPTVSSPWPLRRILLAHSATERDVLRLWIFLISSPPSPATNCKRELVTSPEIAACCAPELQATIVVSGSIEYTPGKIVLHVNVSPVQGEKGIFGKEIILDRTLAMDELMVKPAPKVAASFGQDKTVWTKDEESRLKASPPSPGTWGLFISDRRVLPPGAVF